MVIFLRFKTLSIKTHDYVYFDENSITTSIVQSSVVEFLISTFLLSTAQTLLSLVMFEIIMSTF